MSDKEDDFMWGIISGAIGALVVLAVFGMLFNSSCSVRVNIGTDKNQQASEK